jgi:MFS family permease
MMTSHPLAEAAASDEVQKRNFRNVQIDAIGVGISAGANPFLAVFLARLDATSVQIGLLSSMGAITGLLLGIPVGRFLQTRRNIVPWFSLARLLVISCYALTGLVPLMAPKAYSVAAVLAIWAFATLPQSVVNVAFTVVMNAVAGPQGRYALLSRRWSTLGLTKAVMAFVAGQILDSGIAFPLNYQLVFLLFSVGGLVSFYFSSRIQLPDQEPPLLAQGHSLGQNVRNYFTLLRAEPAFVSFVLKRLVFLFGAALAGPLFTLYFVRQLNATDSWIGWINTVQAFIMIFGYFFWTRLSRRRGGRFVLLLTTLGIALYPALTGITTDLTLITIYVGLAGVFQAGLDLVFFDELMKTVPVEYSATFVALAQSLEHLSRIAAPLAGTSLADASSLSVALITGSVFCLAGFGLFARRETARSRETPPLPPLAEA